MNSGVEEEIKKLIREKGRITFAEFMQSCLYSPNGGFYSTRHNRINSHFGTSPTSHPVFGALIARQLVQMWRLLEEPPVFHVIEVGCGDGSLAQSVSDACRREFPTFSRALIYVAADYQPGLPQRATHFLDWASQAKDVRPQNGQDLTQAVQRIKSEGLTAFRNIAGCILCNELIDNFPVHRFVIQDGRVKEVFVTLEGKDLAEVLDEPSTPRFEERLTDLGVSLPDGFRGEVCLATEDWTRQLAAALERGFVLTIDYGELAADLYSPRNADGTLVCYMQHVAGDDPYRHIGQQDITCQVDFSSLMQWGERRGLSTVGYTRQGRFLKSLGFSSFLDAIETQGLSTARTEFSRTALMTLVDPGEYGDFKVLAQAKGMDRGIELLGFESRER